MRLYPAVILAAGFVAVWPLPSVSLAASDQETIRSLELFGDVLATLEKQYVRPIHTTTAIEAAINGMLQSLDPHSSYMSPEEVARASDQTAGKYGGVGLEFTARDGDIVIVGIMEGSPAARSNIAVGDRVRAVDHQSIIGLALESAVAKMAGRAGQPLTLTLSRNGGGAVDVTMVRQIIKVASVKYRIEGDYGYLGIGSFNAQTGEETRSALRALRTANPRMKGLVLDLRNSPGGVLDQIIEVADLFLDGGEVMSQRGRDSGDVERYNALPGDALDGAPMVVLINGKTASGAEILAGALQARGRAKLVGLTSFGAGTIQTVIPLQGGTRGALRVTTSQAYLPFDRAFQQIGVTPDIAVARSVEEAQDQTDTSSSSEAVLDKAIAGPKARSRVGQVETPPSTFNPVGGDFQLLRAIDLLRSMANPEAQSATK